MPSLLSGLLYIHAAQVALLLSGYDQFECLHCSFLKSKEAIVAAFGMSLTELFDEFDEHPIASGSIGQVHRAVLGLAGSAVTGVPVGTQVAVKVSCKCPYREFAWRNTCVVGSNQLAYVITIEADMLLTGSLSYGR